MRMSRTNMQMVGAFALAFGAFAVATGKLPSVSVSAQAPAQPDLRVEGDWVRTDPEGSGSFDGLGAQFPRAQLTPAAQAQAQAAAQAGGGRGRGDYRAGATAPLRPGEVVVTNPTPCAGRGGFVNTVGAGLITPDSVGIHIVEGNNEVRIAGERAGWRFVYLDGRKHPDPFVPTGAGHSTGRYEGNVLVVETVGFTPGAVPGGGQRTPESKLTERFAVAPNGESMTVTYTWEDAKIYTAPHTYRLIFARAPKVNGLSWAFEEWCDASDPGEGQSIRAPEQR